jgi:hypothetical protein
MPCPDHLAAFPQRIHAMQPDEKFNQVDRPELRRDRFEDFKASTAKHLEYRAAYDEAARLNPDSVKGLPSPNDDPRTFDPEEALQRLRGISQTLRTVPPVDLKT